MSAPGSRALRIISGPDVQLLGTGRHHAAPISVQVLAMVSERCPCSLSICCSTLNAIIKSGPLAYFHLYSSTVCWSMIADRQLDRAGRIPLLTTAVGNLPSCFWSTGIPARTQREGFAALPTAACNVTISCRCRIYLHTAPSLRPPLHFLQITPQVG